MTKKYYPLHSLREGHWFKLICGASFQHLPAVRNLTLAYTLAGADCIDVAADPAVVEAAREALNVAANLKEAAQTQGFQFSHRPWLMVSINDGEDPHFRKAEFDPDFCPADCPRPCERICPAQAIVFHNTTGGEQGSRGAGGRGENSDNTAAFSGVIDQKCYGCGRCVPICPSKLIYTRSYLSAPSAIAQLVLSAGVDALEIHTKVGNFADFQRLWMAIAPWINKLKLLAISCPDGEGLIEYLRAIYDLISPLPCPLIWQTDGRPMSGDISIGATRAAVKLAQKVLAAGLPGYVQLAGGTNAHTVSKLREIGLLKEWGMGFPRERQPNGNGEWGDEKYSPRAYFQNPQYGVGVKHLGDKSSVKPKVLYPNASPSERLKVQPTPHSQLPTANSPPSVAGIAYGSYARVLLSPSLDKLEKINEETIHAHQVFHQSNSLEHLEDFPDLLWEAVATAHSLVSQLKSGDLGC